MIFLTISCIVCFVILFTIVINSTNKLNAIVQISCQSQVDLLLAVIEIKKNVLVIKDVVDHMDDKNDRGFLDLKNTLDLLNNRFEAIKTVQTDQFDKLKEAFKSPGKSVEKNERSRAK